jgi:hypothetical protein
MSDETEQQNRSTGKEHRTTTDRGINGQSLDSNTSSRSSTRCVVKTNADNIDSGRPTNRSLSANKAFRKTRAKATDTSIVLITNDPIYAPARMVEAGYKLGRIVGDMQIWENQLGREVGEVWAFPSSARISGERTANDPLVRQAEVFVDNSFADRDNLVTAARHLRGRTSKSDYTQSYNTFWERFQKWQDELNWIVEEALPPLKDAVNILDQPKISEQINRIKDLERWKADEFPDLVRDLPLGK